MRRDFFVTGTDTGVGKTLVSAALMQRLQQAGLRVAGMKPVAAGLAAAGSGNEDALLLQAAASDAQPYSIVNPCLYQPAIAPHIAAAESGQAMDMGRIDSAFHQLQANSDCVIVEGAGGLLVPMDDERSLAELPQRLGLEVILVVGLRLGCLNHALLTAEALAARGLTLAAWVGNVIDPGMARLEANIETLTRRLSAPCLGIVPWQTKPDPASTAQVLDCRALLHDS